MSSRPEATDDCLRVEVVGGPRHHAVVVRALEDAGLECRWAQPPIGSVAEDLHDLTLVIIATGPGTITAEVVGQLQVMHPRLRVRVDGDC